jgi:hypothetical protein
VGASTSHKPVGPHGGDSLPFQCCLLFVYVSLLFVLVYDLQILPRCRAGCVIALFVCVQIVNVLYDQSRLLRKGLVYVLICLLKFV